MSCSPRLPSPPRFLCFGGGGGGHGTLSLKLDDEAPAPGGNGCSGGAADPVLGLLPAGPAPQQPPPAGAAHLAGELSAISEEDTRYPPLPADEQEQGGGGEVRAMPRLL